MNFSSLEISSFGIVYDLLFAALVLWAALRGRRQGVAASLFRLAGASVGLVGAVRITREWALRLYHEQVAQIITARVAEALAETGGDLAAAVQRLEFLPPSVAETLGDLLYVTTDTLPARVVNALEPVLLPLLQFIIFLVVCLVIRLVFRLISRLLHAINLVPLVGGLNRLLGLAFGVVTGLLDCWLLSLALWFAANVSAGSLSFLTPGVLSHSVIYTALLRLNPFLTFY